MIGESRTRREDERALRGQGRFVDDIELPDMGHLAFLRSPHARAVIKSVCVPDGIQNVITAAELRDRVKPMPAAGLERAHTVSDQHPLLAEDEVRYVGQPVAAVVGASRAAAEDALGLIEVDYEVREPVVDAASAPRALVRWQRCEGNVEGAFEHASQVVSGRYRLPRLVAAPMEARGCVAMADADDGRLTVWCSAQDPHRPRAQLAEVLCRPSEAIRVVVPDVGGAFGSKGVIAPEVAVACIAAIDLGRPVKWVEDRLENFLAAYQGRGIEGELALALDGDGRMLGLKATLRADLGAYLLSTTLVPPHTAAMLLTGCYRIPAVSVEIVGVQTNKVPTGPYRGAGRPDAAYMIERLVDDAARALGMDRIGLRRQNLIRRFPHRTALGLSYDSGDYERCLDRALELAEFEEFESRDPARIVGTGVALFVERAGGMWESAEVEACEDGRLLVRSSASPHGQGHETTFAQIAAHQMGIEIDDIVLRFGDSDEVPAGVGTFGSRSTAMAGSAIVIALEKLIEEGRRRAATALCSPLGGIRHHAGEFIAADRTISLAELAGREPLTASARFQSDLVFSSGAYAAVVEIDRATGHLQVLRIAAVDDAGNLINPLLARGQVIGGTVQALGECLVEEAAYAADGTVPFASFMNYSLPTAAEIPEIRTGEVVSPTPLNPLGAKGVGEGGTIGTLAAVANAVVEALGGHHVDPPFRDEKLWREIA